MVAKQSVTNHTENLERIVFMAEIQRIQYKNNYYYVSAEMQKNSMKKKKKKKNCSRK